MSTLPKGPFDDIRRQVEEILGLPKGSTDPNGNFLSPGETIEKVIKDIKDFLRERRIK